MRRQNNPRRISNAILQTEEDMLFLGEVLDNERDNKHKNLLKADNQFDKTLEIIKKKLLKDYDFDIIRDIIFSKRYKKHIYTRIEENIR